MSQPAPTSPPQSSNQLEVVISRPRLTPIIFQMPIICCRIRSGVSHITRCLPAHLCVCVSLARNSLTEWIGLMGCRSQPNGRDELRFVRSSGLYNTVCTDCASVACEIVEDVLNIQKVP